MGTDRGAPVRVTGALHGLRRLPAHLPRARDPPEPRAGRSRARPLTRSSTRCTGCGECIEVCPADAIEELAMIGPPSRRTVHPIETRSYQILRSRVDLGALPPLSAAPSPSGSSTPAPTSTTSPTWSPPRPPSDAAARRCATARRWSPTSRWSPPGITARAAICRDRRPGRRGARAHGAGITRSAAAVRLAHARGRPRRGLGGRLRPDRAGGAASPAACAPALVIGLPVGFVGAAESKAALREQRPARGQQRQREGRLGRRRRRSQRAAVPTGATREGRP